MSYLEAAKKSLNALREQSASVALTPDRRRGEVAEMIERLNAAYTGGAIDWPKLDEIERRIEGAESLHDLERAMQDYESVVLNQNNAGHNGQYGV